MENKWAIILGCSTGHGAATAKQLASEGFGIIGFHLDRGSIKKDALKFGCNYYLENKIIKEI